MPTFVLPADWELAKEIWGASKDGGLQVLPEYRAEVLEKANKLGFVKDEFYRHPSLFPRLLGWEAETMTIITRAALSSRAAFVTLSVYGDFRSPDDGLYTHPLWRDNLAKEYDIHSFELDFYAWIKEHLSVNGSAAEPVLKDYRKKQ